MNKLIYFETEYDKNKDNLKSLYTLRTEMYSQVYSNLEKVELTSLCELLDRVNKAIEFLQNRPKFS